MRSVAVVAGSYLIRAVSPDWIAQMAQLLRFGELLLADLSCEHHRERMLDDAQ